MSQSFDTNITIGLRRNMLEDIEKLFVEKGYIEYRQVLEAMDEVPRHIFLGKGFEQLSYKNQNVDIEAEQTISKPTTVAIQTFLLNLQKNETVLEIGTGSGYQAAVLSHLAGKVFTIERHEILFQRATKKMKELGLNNVYTFFDDGFKGVPRHAPYDKILITCAAPEIPQNLVAQLKVGGQFVLPVEDGEGQQDMLRLTKMEDGTLAEEKFGKFEFVPMLEGVSK